MPTNTIEYKDDGVYYNGSKIEGPNFENIVQASNYTLTTVDCTGFKLFNNNGATGDITYTLPTAAEGLEVTIVNTEEHNLKVQANSGDLIFTPKYKYGVDYVDVKQSVSTTFYCVNGTDWHAKEDLSTLWGQVQKLVASDAEADDWFGSSVSISGDYAIVGAPDEDTGGGNAGAAYIFHRTGSNTWDTGTKIVASDAQADDYFGISVSISGDYAIVGANGEDAGGTSAGAAYIFYRTEANIWDTGTKIVASDAQAEDSFGSSVSISGDYAIVGARGEDTGGASAGAAYIFHQTGVNTWDTGVKIVASDAQTIDSFGGSVSISGDYTIVGAYQKNSGAGAAYIFHRTGVNTWDTGTKIVASDAEASDNFGERISISGDYAIVGSRGEDMGGSNAGAAYIFHRTGTNTWDTGTKIVASDAQADDYFGISVSISGDYAIVGAHFEDTGGSNAGATYIFHRTGTNAWDAGTKIMASDAQASDFFGSFVSISGNSAIVGAPYEDTKGNNAGSAYIFELE